MKTTNTTWKESAEQGQCLRLSPPTPMTMFPLYLYTAGVGTRWNGKSAVSASTAAVTRCYLSEEHFWTTFCWRVSPRGSFSSVRRPVKLAKLFVSAKLKEKRHFICLYCRYKPNIFIFCNFRLSSKEKILGYQFSDDRYTPSNKYVKKRFPYEKVFVVIH
jgi:hypothetical protein